VTRLVLVLCLLATQAQAVPRCLPHDAMVKALASKCGETRRVLAVNKISAVEMFHNPETGTWTLLITGTNGVSCIRAAGTHLIVEEPEDEAT